MRPSNHHTSHPFDNYVSVVIATDVHNHITIGGANGAVQWIDVKFLLFYILTDNIQYCGKVKQMANHHQQGI